MHIVPWVVFKTLKPQYKNQDVRKDDEKKNVSAEPMIPEALREPNLFEQTLEKLVISYEKNLKVKSIQN